MLSVGSLLKQSRETKKYSLKDAEKQVKIRQKYIMALENDAWDIFTSKIYIEGILKNYSRFLELDEKKILAFFRREYEKKEEIKFKRRVQSRYLSPDSRKTITTIFVCVGCILLAYVIFQFYLYLKPPHIEIVIPQETVTHNIDRMTIKGQTEKEALLTVNGERVYLDKEGGFEYILPLKKEKNLVHFEVVGANGKKTTADRVITRKK